MSSQKDSKNPERGFHFERTEIPDHQGERERAFAQQWEYEHALKGKGEASLVQQLCVRNVNPFRMFSGEVITEITPRDRKIVATIIQWLGSNVGWSFLTEALKRAGYKIERIETKPDAPKRPYWRDGVPG